MPRLELVFRHLTDYIRSIMTALSFLPDIESITPTPILVAPQPVLRAVAREVTADDMALVKSHLPGMFSAMYKAPGIGLAAPQIGLGLRFALVDVADEGERNPMVLINPEIIEESEQLAAREEGCLSLPNQYAEVIRPLSVRMRYRNLEGEVIEMEADDLLATCLQHEIDHLDGILFVDHLSKLKRNMIMRRLAKEQKGR
ncbi:Peptide deformylase [Asaia bogorensis]|uniref:Peptide deformylase n=2 Tax=Acetobacteraceae TaxID=433 RepID=A0A060QGF5_9PROT|nr:peptide deformylase [Asaia bogorensis NBRC 16594]CDG38351.1 Peptide deformylase [Asaia bogorensis]